MVYGQDDREAEARANADRHKRADKAKADKLKQRELAQKKALKATPKSEAEAQSATVMIHEDIRAKTVKQVGKAVWRDMTWMDRHALCAGHLSVKAAKAKVAAETNGFKPGDLVQVCGLVNATELNGIEGRCVEFIPAQREWAIEVEGKDEYLGLSPDKLKKSDTNSTASAPTAPKAPKAPKAPELLPFHFFRVYYNDYMKHDVTQTGTLNKEEALNLAKYQLGRKGDPQACAAFAAEMDADHDGLVTLDEYIEMVLQNKFKVCHDGKSSTYESSTDAIVDL